MGPRDRPHLTPQRLPPPFAATPHSVTKRRVPLGGTLRRAGVDRIDIRNFHEALQAVANFLEAAAHATAYGQEARNQAAEVADLP